MPCPLDRARGGPRTPTGTVTAVPCDIQTARVDAPSLPMHTLSIGVSCGSSGAWCPGSQPFCFVSKGMCQAGRPVFVGSWLVWGARPPVTHLDAAACLPSGSAVSRRAFWPLGLRPRVPRACLSARLAPSCASGLFGRHFFKEYRLFPARGQPHLSLSLCSSWHALGCVTCHLLSVSLEDTVPHGGGEPACFLVQQ